MFKSDCIEHIERQLLTGSASSTANSSLGTSVRPAQPHLLRVVAKSIVSLREVEKSIKLVVGELPNGLDKQGAVSIREPAKGGTNFKIVCQKPNSDFSSGEALASAIRAALFDTASD